MLLLQINAIEFQWVLMRLVLGGLFTALLIIIKGAWSIKEGLSFYSKLFILPMANNITITCRNLKFFFFASDDIKKLLE